MDKHKFRQNTQRISVYVRLRPLNPNEKNDNVVQVLNAKEVLINNSTRKKLSFDGVFGMQSTQSSVYEMIVKPLIPEIVSGYNCTVFAYGQTGTGKTFTMTEGISFLRPLASVQNIYRSPKPTDFKLDERSGLIPRLLTELFISLQTLQQQYTVQCSYLEIYNEDLRDLLHANDNQLKIYDDQRNKGGVIIQGIEEVTISNTFDGVRLLQRGQERRQISATQMNDRSSRSHTIFTVIVHTREVGKDCDELVKMGKINLVDLAGSENINRSGAIEQRAREAGNINQSLLTLGRVIKALSEKKSHIPFRESKLTRILQDSLGGKTKTSIIATISPCASNLEETLSTLDYAHRAGDITNKPEINQKFSQKKLIAEYAETIKRLEKDLESSRTDNGIFLDKENYMRLVIELQNHKDEMTRKMSVINDLDKQLEVLQREMEIREREWLDMCISFENAKFELEKERILCERTEREKKEQEYLANKFQANAENLQREARGLLNLIETSSYNGKLLMDKITKLYEIAESNNKTVRNCFANIDKRCAAIRDTSDDFKTAYDEFNRDLVDAIDRIQQKHYEHCQRIEMEMCAMHNSMENKYLNFFDMERLIKGEINKCLDIAISLQKTSHKEVESFHDSILKYDQELKANWDNVLQAAKRFSEKLSRDDWQIVFDDFRAHINTLLEDQERLPESIDSVTSNFDRILEDFSKTVDSRFDAIQSEVDKVRSDVKQHESLFYETHDGLQTELVKSKEEHEAFVRKSMNSALKMNDSAMERIQDDFANTSEGIVRDLDQLLTKLHDMQPEVRNDLYEIGAVQKKDVDATSAELVKACFELQNSEDLSKSLIDIKQSNTNAKYCLSRLRLDRL